MKMNYTLAIGLTTFLAAIITTTLTYYKEQASARKAEAANSRIVDLQQELIDKQSELLNKSDELNNEITGGNSYCILGVHLITNRHENIEGSSYSEFITLVNKGKYSLQNINARIEKPKFKLERLRLNSNTARLDDLEYSFQIPSLIGNKDNENKGQLLSSKPIADELLKSGRITYAANIETRKGRYLQIIKLANFKGSWLQATKLTDESNQKVVYEYIDPLFPKNEDGSMDWKMIQ